MIDLFHQRLKNMCERRGDATAIELGRRCITYAELNHGASEYEQRLRNAGLRAGERVVVYCEPSAEVVVAIFGLLRAGGVVVTTHRSFGLAKLRRQVEDCSAEYLITDHKNVEEIWDEAERAPLVLEVGKANVWPCDQQSRSVRRSKVTVQKIGTGDSLAAIFYTSGSSAFRQSQRSDDRSWNDDTNL